MVRYLIHFQYIGTKYCGVVKASHKTMAETGMVGVQDVIENALARINPYKPTRIFVSSRTDSGVHALCNTAHFDLVRPPHKRPAISGDSLCQGLNYYIGKKEPIRILAARQVPDNFHSQHMAIKRSYLYRLATGCTFKSLPITERHRCWAVRHELNLEAMAKAAKIFLGTHDFSAFRSSSKERIVKSPIKTIDSIEIAPSRGFLSRHWPEEYTSNIRFCEVVFRSRSFLYRQIRRMMSALVSVGKGRLSIEELQDVLDSCDNTHPQCGPVAPPDGLYLREVLYNPQDLILEDSDDSPSHKDEFT